MKPHHLDSPSHLLPHRRLLWVNQATFFELQRHTDRFNHRFHWGKVTVLDQAESHPKRPVCLFAVSGNVMEDMGKQLQANNIRISILEEENSRLRNAIGKMKEPPQQEMQKVDGGPQGGEGGAIKRHQTYQPLGQRS